MKPQHYLLTILTAALLVFTTCEKPERDNPWDSMANLDPGDWAPKNLQITLNSISSVTINWDYEDRNIEGFRIDRKTGSGAWEEEYTYIDADKKSFDDNNVNLTANSYSYRLYAYAGSNTSAKVEDVIQLSVPTVTTEEVTDITEATAKSGGNVTGIDVNARGVVWSTSPSPELTTKTDKEKSENKDNVSTVKRRGEQNRAEKTIKQKIIDKEEQDKNSGYTVDGSGTGAFTSNITGLTAGTTYYVRAYATNDVGTAYGEQKSFTTLEDDDEATLPTVTTADITNITENSAIGGGNITSDGGANVTARGIAYSTSQNPTTSDNTVSSGSGTGSFEADMTGLDPNTTYYVRAFATNSEGTAYGEQKQFRTIGDNTTVVEVTNPTTGKTWMDRNLGASRAATSSTDSEAYGHLYQWGRAADGHQIRTSGTTSALSDSDTPGHGNFITTGSSPYDWRSPQNDDLWQGVNGTNNPCPAGFRLPTEAELDAERQSWSSDDAAGAYGSPLKLPVAGYRYYSNGSLGNVGSGGDCWSSTVDGTFSRGLYFYSSGAGMRRYYRASGISVRCLKDD